MASDDVGIVSGSLPSLEHLHTELIQAGFNPSDPHLRCWKGPIAEPFRQLTSATTMRLVFQDGWPFLAPKIFVYGILSEHVNSDGEVCLWTAGDSSLEWLTLDGIYDRIKLWTQRALHGFKEEDLVLDAHLYFEKKDRTLALIDIPSLHQGTFADDDRGDLKGILDANKHIWISAGLGDSRFLRGRWYFRSRVSIPPRNLSTFRDALTTNQRRNFDRKIEATKKHGENALQFAALIWPTSKGLNAQIIKFQLTGTEIEASALQVAPMDEQSLRLRSGRDSKVLSNKRVALFGLGAIGSHVAILLAEMGVPTLVLVDGDILRPGNVVRHAASRQFIGFDKVTAVAKTIGEHTPWTNVETNTAFPWHPVEIKKLLHGADAVVEATGLSSFAAHLSTITEEASLPFVSVALYRGGKIARIRRHMPGRDFPIYRRKGVEKYPIIPPGEDEVLGLEVGCSDPIINASPASVASAATIAVRVTVDILGERVGLEEELIQVYEPLDPPPFDKIGVIAI
jgi:hypothetical protein